MSLIHFFNVKDGDCSVIEHTSGRISVIDICNGNAGNAGNDGEDEENKTVASKESLVSPLTEAQGNFGQKNHPENPISYLYKLRKKEIFRFILTHPDMDHMDGFKRLFDEFNVINFWDTENNKEIKNFGNIGAYNKADWDAYQNRRKIDREGARTLHIYDGDTGKYFNRDDDGGNGDCLQVLCPTEDLVKEVNDAGKNANYNNISYVILYNEFGKKILFPGDAEDDEWDVLLENHGEELRNIDILIAPHHGRKSGGNDEFLKVLRPKLTLFGNANCEHLNYADWNNLDLLHYTNNQAGTFVLNVTPNGIFVYCSNEKLAKKENQDTFYDGQLAAWYLGWL